MLASHSKLTPAESTIFPVVQSIVNLAAALGALLGPLYVLSPSSLVVPVLICNTVQQDGRRVDQSISNHRLALLLRQLDCSSLDSKSSNMDYSGYKWRFGEPRFSA